MTIARAPAPQRVFISDCEGPISKNDNAFELAKHFIPKGDVLFTQISRYDDVLADVVKREGYKAGDTLKLILPFLRAHDVSNQIMIEFSSHNIMLMSGAREMLGSVRGFMPAYIVSTSYEQYMRALCDAVSFPFQNVRSTHLDLDSYAVRDEEKEQIKQLAEEIVELPMLKIPKKAHSLRAFPEKMRDVVKRMDEIFWSVIPSMKIGRVFSKVNPIGGSEKATAVKDIIAKMHVGLESVMYVGDSITDVAVFQLVRNGGGLTVSFNGNSYAVREAEVAVLAPNAVVTAVLADVFNRFGKGTVMSLIKDWNRSALKKTELHAPLKAPFFKIFGEKLPKVERVTRRNMAKLAEESTRFRKDVRGEAVGRLG